MAARLLAIAVVLAMSVACAAGSSSTTVLTGPERQRWDAQSLVGACIEHQDGGGWAQVVEVPCDHPRALEVLNVVNDPRDCHPDTVYSHTWPAQGPDPNVVVCAG